MTDPRIRDLEPRDIPEIGRWVVNVPLWQRYNVQRKALETGLERGDRRGDHILVAVDDESVCGFAWCMPKGMFGGFPYLKLLGVKPSHQEHGTGGELLATIEELVSASGPTQLFLLVSDFNTSAQQFYAHRGYEQVGSIPKLLLPDVDELIFAKRLTTLA